MKLISKFSQCSQLGIFKVFISILLLAGCGGGSATVSYNDWTWMSGANTINQSGNYGIQAVADASNMPGAREQAISWYVNGEYWLFGGIGYGSGGGVGILNDLWKFDGVDWTWVSGDNTVNQSGSYGVQGIAAGTNVPGGREQAVSWSENGYLWLFGGFGYDSVGAVGSLSDLWKYDGINWTWVSGADTVNQSGSYGVQGIAAGTNVPGGREQAVSWSENGYLWLFGGYGRDSVGTMSRLNDLWKFDGADWTWVSGAKAVNQIGRYDIQGVSVKTNVPGARNAAVSWINNGELWLFGGFGYGSTSALGYLGDLWKFDGTNWIWISGDNTLNQLGSYGTKGIAAETSMPGARRQTVIWSGNRELWLFGGYGYDSVGGFGQLNDLWRYRL